MSEIIERLWIRMMIMEHVDEEEELEVTVEEYEAIEALEEEIPIDYWLEVLNREDIE